MSTQAIKLTVLAIDGEYLPSPTVYGFDLFDIVEPIRTDSNLTNSILVTRNVKGNSQSNKSLGKVTYLIDEDVTTIINKNPDMIFGGNVTKRNFTLSPSLFISKTAFLYSRVSGFLTPDITSAPGINAFYYNEDGDPYNVYYELGQDIITNLS